MKTLLALSLCVLALFCEARPRSFHRCPYRKPTQTLSWKPILASGAAAGTVIAAYKVSNGIEEGLQTAAEKHPETFTKATSSIFTPLKIIAGGMVAVLLIVLVFRSLPTTIHTYKQLRKELK